MVKKRYLVGAALVAALLGVTAAIADGYFPAFPVAGGQPNTVCVNNVNGSCVLYAPAGPPLTGNETVPADTHLAQGVSPQTVNVPVSTLTEFNAPRNVLGNAQVAGQQVNGTGTVTFATTSSPTTAALVADRWVGDVNVTSGAGRSAIITSSPTLPSGFQYEVEQWRNSGSLAQPICSWQAVPTPSATQLAGQTVTLSVYAQALSALAADNGGQINLVVITGTGTDQGFNGAWTASPALTPAWTGIATAVNSTQSINSSVWSRVYTTAAIPAAATEIGVGVCFTPTTGATGNSTPTDGFVWTGAQLERGVAPSPFVFRDRALDMLSNQQYLYVVTEGAVGSVRAPGLASTTSLVTALLQFPTAMYKTPTMSYTAGFGSCSTTACSAQTACTVLRTSTLQSGFAPDANRVPLDCTSTTGFPAAGTSVFLMDDGGSGKIIAWTGL
jgi:hypothetical protein